VLEVVEGETAGDDVERPVRIRHLVDVASAPFHVFDAAAARQFAGLIEHRLGGVESDDALHAGGHRAGDGAGAVNGAVPGIWLRGVNDERDDLVAMEFRRDGEVHRLSAELVLNRAPVSVVVRGGHGIVPIAEDKWLRPSLRGDRSDKSQDVAEGGHDQRLWVPRGPVNGVLTRASFRR
jgi:hypothetical protein